MAGLVRDLEPKVLIFDIDLKKLLWYELQTDRNEQYYWELRSESISDSQRVTRSDQKREKYPSAVANAARIQSNKSLWSDNLICQIS